jgi:hypothetical protein
MDKQEDFDKVARHLLRQGRRSVSEEGGCLYRSPDGCMCAVGCLIDDEHYTREIEHHLIYERRVIDALRGSGVDLLDGVTVMLRSLQVVHDGVDPLDWAIELRGVARRHRLSTAAIDEVTA